MLGGRDVVAAGRIHHDDAACGRRRDVDVVDADAGAADDAELAGVLERVGGHFAAAPDHERVVLPDDARQLVRLHAGLQVELDLGVRGEDVDTLLVERVGREDSIGHGVRSLQAAGAAGMPSIRIFCAAPTPLPKSTGFPNAAMPISSAAIAVMMSNVPMYPRWATRQILPFS